MVGRRGGRAAQRADASAPALPQLARAALESIAFQVEDVVAAVEREVGPVETLLADGGPTANRALMQLQADTSGRRVEARSRATCPRLAPRTSPGWARASGRATALEALERDREHYEPAEGAGSRERRRRRVARGRSTRARLGAQRVATALEPSFDRDSYAARGGDDMRFGAGIWLFGQFVDRYATDAYGPPVSTLEAIERAGAVGDIEVLDINYPFSDPDITVDEVARRARRRRHARRGASRRTSTCASSPAARSPTPTRPFAGARSSSASRRVDVARQLGAPTVKLWPGQDGFDYPFQADYRELWRLELEGVRTVAEMDPGMRVAIEYKTKEPRTHISFSTAARTLLGIEQLGRDDVGIVVDLGHSLFAKETPADVLSLVHEHGRLFTIEVNDNWREWDDDMAVGSVHLIETLEFFLEVRKIGWDEPILLDQFPFREDPVEAARSSIQHDPRDRRARSTGSTSRRCRRAGAPGRARRAAAA